MSRVVRGSRLFPEWDCMMIRREFKHITYHTPLSEEVREKIAKAYGKNCACVLLEDISIKDAHTLIDLGYTIHHKNNKIEIQL
jgi:ribosomal protein S24E